VSSSGPDMLSAKISHGVELLDADGDGRLTEDDHVLMGRRVAAGLGHPPGSAQEQRIIEAYRTIWGDLHLSHLPGGATSITKEQFIQSTRSLATDPAAARATVGALAEAFIAITDLDRDGYISPAEFLAFQRGHFPSLAQADADEAFRHLDQDGDGYLSADEFITAIVEYWSSEDPDAPGNWAMGRPTYQR
jgi:Ca2+-binding EF-hand superfamily protein